MRHVATALMLGFVLTGCTSSQHSDAKEDAKAQCEEPVNPYDEGTGHYAGYEWAESRGSGTCDGSSQSFNEGCEEYESQVAEYDECEAEKHK